MCKVIMAGMLGGLVWAGEFRGDDGAAALGGDYDMVRISGVGDENAVESVVDDRREGAEEKCMT